jgi:hypothetical protein
MIELLSKWWSDKYRLPSNHELFQTSTVFELLTEFWEDQYYKNPLEAYRNTKGEVQFIQTGDEFIDKWEKELAEGKIPNYLESFSQEQIDKLNRLRTHGVDRFGKSSTMKEIMDTVSQDALRQGLNNPSTLPSPYKRFSDIDLPE